MIAASTAEKLSFVDALRDSDAPILSPKKYSEMLHISIQTVAEMAKVHRSTVVRAPESEKLQTFLRDAVSILSLIEDANGGDFKAALFAFRNLPLTEMGGLTAEQLVARGEVEAVRRYVRNASAGATG